MRRTDLQTVVFHVVVTAFAFVIVVRIALAGTHF